MKAQNTKLKYTFVRLRTTKEPVCLLNGEFENSNDEYLFWAIDEVCDPNACEFSTISLDSPASLYWPKPKELDDGEIIQYDDISLTENNGWMIGEEVKKIKDWHRFLENRNYAIVKIGDNNDTTNN